MRAPFFLLLMTLLLAGSSSIAQRIETKDRIMYSNIAPGELENDLIKKMPVKIAFSSESRIPYGGVFVRIFDASGIAVFKHLCEKPWLFLRLPAGEYNVVAVDRKKVTRIKPFKVKPEGQAVVKLTWPASVVGY